MATVQHVAVGPLDIRIDAPDQALMDAVSTSLVVYDLIWTLGSMKPVELDCVLVRDSAEAPARGEYMEAARMRVDRTALGMRATTDHGATLTGTFGDEGDRWLMHVPAEVSERGLSWEIEDLLSLVLTSGWRRAGWVPLHAAGLTDGTRGIIVCATSGGGKTTFTMAMVRAGWRALGDDKLLLRTDGDAPLIAGLKHMLNVDPKVDAWFPEIGDLRVLPEYSTWTPKRRVALSSLWPDSTAVSMRPTTIVSLERQSGRGGMVAEEMDAAATIATLLRQTVIPNDPAEARWITRELAACARDVQGIRVTVADDAYTNDDSIIALARELR